MSKIENEIQDLEKQIENYGKRIRECQDKIQTLQFKSNSNGFEGKYIYFMDYGYMYVRWQEFDTHTGKIFFQGVSFRCRTSPYLDDNFAEFDTMKEWYISPGVYRKALENGDIKTITKEEFISAYKSNVERFFPNFESCIETAEQHYNKCKQLEKETNHDTDRD